MKPISKNTKQSLLSTHEYLLSGVIPRKPNEETLKKVLSVDFGSKYEPFAKLGHYKYFP